MKTSLTLFAALTALVASSYAQTTVSSANVVGYGKIDIKPKGAYHLISCNFEAGTSNTLSSIFGTNQLRRSSLIFNCDRVSLYDSSAAQYSVWAQRTDGKFYKANSATEWGLSIQGDPEVPTGSGLWVTSPAGSSTTNTIYISGDVIVAPTQVVSIVSGYQILSYPFSSELALQSTALSTNGAKSALIFNCDRVVFWDGSAYQTYGLNSDGKWYKANNATEWGQKVLATNQIRMGEAFWYIAKSGHVWSETNVYLNAIQ